MVDAVGAVELLWDAVLRRLTLASGGLAGGHGQKFPVLVERKGSYIGDRAITTFCFLYLILFISALSLFSGGHSFTPACFVSCVAVPGVTVPLPIALPAANPSCWLPSLSRINLVSLPCSNKTPAPSPFRFHLLNPIRPSLAFDRSFIRF